MQWVGRSVNPEVTPLGGQVHTSRASIVYDGPSGLAVVQFSAKFRFIGVASWVTTAIGMQVSDVLTGEVLVQGTSGPDPLVPFARFSITRSAVVELVSGRAYQLGLLDQTSVAVLLANGFWMVVQ